MEKKLMEYLTFFEIPDLIGFAKFMEVDNEIIKKVLVSSAAMSQDNNQNWEDLICSAVENFSQKNRFEKRKILKMVKQIKQENADFCKKEDKNSSPTE